MYNVMRIVEGETLDTHFLPGHDEQDAIASFGEDIEVTKLVAVDAKMSDAIEDLINEMAEEEG